jgi:hypothetical protein
MREKRERAREPTSGGGGTTSKPKLTQSHRIEKDTTTPLPPRRCHTHTPFPHNTITNNNNSQFTYLEFEPRESSGHLPEPNVPRPARHQPPRVVQRKSHVEHVLAKRFCVQGDPLLAPVPHRQDEVRARRHRRQHLPVRGEAERGVALLCALSQHFHHLPRGVAEDVQVRVVAFLPDHHQRLGGMHHERADAAPVHAFHVAPGWGLLSQV